MGEPLPPPRASSASNSAAVVFLGYCPALPIALVNCASSMAAVHVDEDKDGNRNLYLTGKTGKTTVLTNIVQKGATWVFAESMVRRGASSPRFTASL